MKSYIVTLMLMGTEVEVYLDSTGPTVATSRAIIGLGLTAEDWISTAEYEA